jgi:hypothetical protein
MKIVNTDSAKGRHLKQLRGVVLRPRGHSTRRIEIFRYTCADAGSILYFIKMLKI